VEGTDVGGDVGMRACQWLCGWSSVPEVQKRIVWCRTADEAPI